MGQADRDMVAQQLVPRGIDDPRVLQAMRRLPRALFVPRARRADAHRDGPVSIGLGQTISQPYIVALMLQAARVGPQDRVLDVGAGSGYTTALLSLLAAQVFAIERHADLLDAAAARWRRLHRHNISSRCGDGSLGWPDAAPFDAILVGAGGREVPPALLAQLAPHGRLVIPVERGTDGQVLIALRQDAQGRLHERRLCDVRFVPLVGAQGWRDAEGG